MGDLSRPKTVGLGPRKSELKRYGPLPSFALPGVKTQTVNPDFKELLLTFNAHNVEYGFLAKWAKPLKRFWAKSPFWTGLKPGVNEKKT